MRITALSCAFIMTVVLAGLGAYDATANTYRWESDAGTLSFTDEAKHIPKRYRDAAVLVELKTMAKKNFTHTTMAKYETAVRSRLEYLRKANASIPILNANYGFSPEQPITQTRRLNRRLSKGGGRVTIVQERRTVDGINKPMYVVYGPYGEELIVTPYPTNAGVYQELPFRRR